MQYKYKAKKENTHTHTLADWDVRSTEDKLEAPKQTLLSKWNMFFFILVIEREQFFSSLILIGKIVYKMRWILYFLSVGFVFKTDDLSCID